MARSTTLPDDDHGHLTVKRPQRVTPLLRDAMYEHIARRVLQHQDVHVIALAVGLRPVTVQRILRTPEFAETYTRVKRELYGSIDEAMYDQRRTILERVEAGAPRALTELFNLIENGRSERVRKEAAELVLGIGGHTPVQRRVTAEIPVAQLNDHQLSTLASAFSTAVRRDEAAITVEATANDVDSE